MTSAHQLTEDMVCRLLMRDRWRKHTMLARYCPPGWHWECDVIEITRAGYWTEFEVKLTLADYHRDAEKQNRKGQFKHTLMQCEDQGPARFYYVTPYGLLNNVPLPAWAGLIEVCGQIARPNSLHGLSIVQKVEAPRRHKLKAESVRAAIFETCYWRFHRK